MLHKNSSTERVDIIGWVDPPDPVFKTEMADVAIFKVGPEFFMDYKEYGKSAELTPLSAQEALNKVAENSYTFDPYVLKEYFDQKLIDAYIEKHFDVPVKETQQEKKGPEMEKKTFTEDIDTIKKFVIERSNSTDKKNPGLFNHYAGMIDNKALLEPFKNFNEQINKGGIFKNNEKLVVQLLSDINSIALNARLGNAELAGKFNQDMHKTHYKFEAKQLLSGYKFEFNELATAETGQLRATINQRNEQLFKISEENKGLRDKLQKVSAAYTTVVSNLKEKLGFSTQQIKDLHQDVKQTQQRGKDQEFSK